MYDFIGTMQGRKEFNFTSLIDKIHYYEKISPNKYVNYLIMSQNTLEDLIKLDSSHNFIQIIKSDQIKKKEYDKDGTEYCVMQPIYKFLNKYYISICNEIGFGAIHIV